MKKRARKPREKDKKYKIRVFNDNKELRGKIFFWILIALIVLGFILILLKLTGKAVYDSGNNIIYECGEINESGNYVLNQSINGSGIASFTPCLNISADNVVIDGKGFDLFGNDTIVTSGISAEGRRNVTIKNFKNITDFYYGVSFLSVNNSIIRNLTASSNGAVGVSLEGYFNVLEDLALNYNGYALSVGGISNNITNIIGNNNGGGAEFYGLTNEETTDFSTNNIFTNLTFNHNFYSGATLSYLSENVFSGITVNNNSRHGMDFEGDVYNNVFNNVVANNNSRNGIDLDTTQINSGNVSGNVFDNVTANYNKQNGIYLIPDLSYNIFGNTFNNVVASYNKWNGIQVVRAIAYNNRFAGVTANSNTQYGVDILKSPENILTDINASSNNYGIYFDESSNNILMRVTTNSNTNYGVRFDESSNNTLTSITANSNNMYGILLDSSSNNIFKDGNASGNPSNDIHLSQSINNSFINMSITYDDEAIDKESSLFRKWWLDASSNVAGTSITWADTLNNSGSSLTSPTSTRFELAEYYFNKSDYIYYSDYLVSASKTGYTASASQSINMSGNRARIFTMTAIDDGNGGGDGGGGGGGGSSGGGGAGFWKKTISVSSSQIENGYSKELARGERIAVSIQGISGQHYIGVVSVTGTSAVINISSSQAFFNIGDEKSFDVTGEGVNDVDVKLVSINNSKVLLSVKKSFVASSSGNLTSNISTAEIISGSGQQIWWIYIIIFAIIVFIAIIAVFFYVQWRRRNAEMQAETHQKPWTQNFAEKNNFDSQNPNNDNSELSNY